MGLDGFSMGNLGLHNNLTSAQMANNAEQLALRGSEFQIKFVDKLSKRKGIERKKEDENQKEKKQSDDVDFNDFFEENQDELPIQNPPPETKNSQDNPHPQKSVISKDFSVRINKETEKIELLNNKNGRIIQTISPNDLISLVSKLDSASGIFVNKKI